jgi:hypothetical protein
MELWLPCNLTILSFLVEETAAFVRKADAQIDSENVQ